MALNKANETQPEAPAAATTTKKPAKGKTTRRRGVKKTTAAKGGKAKPAKGGKKKAAAKKAAPVVSEAKRIEREGERRQKAIELITHAAEAAAEKKVRLEEFIRRLQIRIDRGQERVDGAVAAEKARQASAVEKDPALKKCKKGGAKALADAAKLPKVELDEESLPSYITAIKVD